MINKVSYKFKINELDLNRVESVEEWKKKIRKDLGRYGLKMLELSKHKQNVDKQ